MVEGLKECAIAKGLRFVRHCGLAPKSGYFVDVCMNNGNLKGRKTAQIDRQLIDNHHHWRGRRKQAGAREVGAGGISLVSESTPPEPKSTVTVLLESGYLEFPKQTKNR